MTQTKSWYSSTTVWGGLVALLAGVASWFKYSLDAELMADIANWVTSVATIIGAGIAIWGRIRASKQIAPPRTDTTPPRSLGLLLCLVLGVWLFAAGGCTPAQSYVQADRETFQAITPEYSVYVATDEQLTPEEKERRARTVATWDLRLRNAERQFEEPFGGIRSDGGQGSGAGTPQPAASAGAQP